MLGVPSGSARSTTARRGRAERFFWHGMLRGAWAEFRESILEAWVAARPGTRPAGWWQYDAAEPRRVLHGRSLLETGPAVYLEARWRRDDGIPATRRVPNTEDSRLVVEAQAAYLGRLRLLSRDERRALRARDFEPVELSLEASA
jgi:hypothetical protein